jgi:hypothetical protein
MRWLAPYVPVPEGFILKKIKKILSGSPGLYEVWTKNCQLVWFCCFIACTDKEEILESVINIVPDKIIQLYL